jgi:hypothetical protein
MNFEFLVHRDGRKFFFRIVAIFGDPRKIGCRASPEHLVEMVQYIQSAMFEDKEFQWLRHGYTQ